MGLIAAEDEGNTLRKRYCIKFSEAKWSKTLNLCITKFLVSHLCNNIVSCNFCVIHIPSFAHYFR